MPPKNKSANKSKRLDLDKKAKQFLVKKLTEFANMVSTSAGNKSNNAGLLRPLHLFDVFPDFFGDDVLRAASAEGNKLLLLFENNLAEDMAIDEKDKYDSTEVEDVEFSKGLQLLLHDLAKDNASISDSVAEDIGKIVSLSAKIIAADIANRCEQKGVETMTDEQVREVVPEYLSPKLQLHALNVSERYLSNYKNGILKYERGMKQTPSLAKRKTSSSKKPKKSASRGREGTPSPFEKSKSTGKSRKRKRKPSRKGRASASISRGQKGKPAPYSGSKSKSTSRGRKGKPAPYSRPKSKSKSRGRRGSPASYKSRPKPKSESRGRRGSPASYKSRPKLKSKSSGRKGSPASYKSRPKSKSKSRGRKGSSASSKGTSKSKPTSKGPTKTSTRSKKPIHPDMSKEVEEFIVKKLTEFTKLVSTSAGNKSNNAGVLKPSHLLDVFPDFFGDDVLKSATAEGNKLLSLFENNLAEEMAIDEKDKWDDRELEDKEFSSGLRTLLHDLVDKQASVSDSVAEDIGKIVSSSAKSIADDIANRCTQNGIETMTDEQVKEVVMEYLPPKLQSHALNVCERYLSNYRQLAQSKEQ